MGMISSLLQLPHYLNIRIYLDIYFFLSHLSVLKMKNFYQLLFVLFSHIIFLSIFLFKFSVSQGFIMPSF